MRTPVILPPLRTPVRLEDLPPNPPPRPVRTPVILDQPPRTRENEFWTFVAERHDVFIKRVIERRPPPWTDDDALARWHYTCVYRELDRVTLDLIEHAIRPWASVRYPMLRVFPVVVYRTFNEPATFAALRPYLSWSDPATIERLLLDRQAAGHTVFRAAYRVQSSRETGEGARIRTWVRRLWEIASRMGGSAPPGTKHPDKRLGMRETHTWLTSLPGFGPFLAYEVLVDLCYEPAVLPFSENDWVNVGPGAAVGLQALGLAPTEDSIRRLAARQRDGLARAGRVLRGPDLTLRNIEHVCCEFSKYVRARAGGHNKRRFTWRAERDDFSPWDGLDSRYWKAP